MGGPKTSLDDLAVFGAPPAFDEKKHVGRPNLGSRERLMARIDGILERRWLTNDGPLVLEFERRISAMLGVKHCVATCNGTLALELAVRAAGLAGEVIIPSFTFVATAHALQWLGIRPVFCDIDSRTHTLVPAQVERLITPRTTGIIGVHVWGQPCDIRALAEIARRRNLQLLFDASPAFGCSWRGRMIGGFGRAEVFSFHATKFLNTGEGGAVVSNDDDLASRVRLMRNFGFSGYDRVIRLGTNAKMSELSAALGLTNLESIDSFVEANKRNYRSYRRELQEARGVRLFAYDETERCNYQYIVVEIDEGQARISRDDLVEVLHAENILARRYFHPGCHRLEPYHSASPHAGSRLAETEALTERVLVLPTGTAISGADIAAICEIGRLAVTHGADLTRKLRDIDLKLGVDTHRQA